MKYCIAFIVAFLLMACLRDDPDTFVPPIPEQTSPMICEGDFFVKTSDTEVGNSFFIGDQQTSFYSLTADKLYKYDLNNFQVLSQKFFISGVNFGDFSPLSNQTGWLLTRSLINNVNRWMVSLLDATGTIVTSRELDVNLNEHAIAATPDNGFMLVTNVTGPDRYTVAKHSDAGNEVWKKELVNRGIIKKILLLSDGSFLLGGLTYATAQGSITSNSFLAKLDNNGNEVWKKESHPGDFNNRYAILDIVEGALGDFYILLLNERSNLSLVKADSAYTIKWTTIIDSQFSFSAAKMISENNDIIVYHSAGTGQNDNDIHLTSLGGNGNIQWKSKFGGTGYENVYSLLTVPSTGYFVIGQTSNWDGLKYDPTTSTYVIKTDQEGVSCK